MSRKLNKISKARPELRKVTNILISQECQGTEARSFSQNEIPIMGCIKLKLKIGNNFNVHKFIVSNMVEHDF